MIHPDWKEVLFNRSIAFAGTAAFPRLTHMMRWPTRLGPRGVLAYVAFNTVTGFALRAWLVPYFKRTVDVRQRAEHELREQLGRDPTTDEVLAHLGIERVGHG